MTIDLKPSINFNVEALKIFNYQYNNNKVYNKYCNLLKIKNVSKIEEIPFLPIKFFKSHEVICKDNYSHVFKSSGTEGIKSKHYISDINLYIKSFVKTFKIQYGEIKGTVFLGLLPSYLEQGNSSLVFMVNHLINSSEQKESGFYLNDYKKLFDLINNIKNKKIILFGVSYALLDFVEKYPVKSKNLIIIETGGMKGRRKEITKEELYSKLEKGFHTDLIHSEYGMTELLSQAYSKNNGVFKTTNWLKVFNRNINNPFDVNSKGKGVLNFIDLANINSCSFIATDDIGEVFSNNSFKVLGRLNESDIRGCSLMFNQL